MDRERTKGPDKRLVRVPFASHEANYVQEEALADYDRVFVIDTNSIRMAGEPVSVSSIAVCTLRRNRGGRGTLLSMVQHVGAFEFRGLTKDQERFGWLLFQNAIVRGPSFCSDGRYLLVTDHALSEHDAINARTTALFGETFLHSGISIGYASSDSGRAYLQKVIRNCDRLAKRILSDLRSARITEPPPSISNAPVTHLRGYQYPSTPANPYVANYVLSADFPNSY
jgi:hypothetical protein